MKTMRCVLLLFFKHTIRLFDLIFILCGLNWAVGFLFDAWIVDVSFIYELKHDKNTKLFSLMTSTT